MTFIILATHLINNQSMYDDGAMFISELSESLWARIREAAFSKSAVAWDRESYFLCLKQ